MREINEQCIILEFDSEVEIALGRSKMPYKLIPFKTDKGFATYALMPLGANSERLEACLEIARGFGMTSVYNLDQERNLHVLSLESLQNEKTLGQLSEVLTSNANWVKNYIIDPDTNIYWGIF